MQAAGYVGNSERHAWGVRYIFFASSTLAEATVTSSRRAMHKSTYHRRISFLVLVLGVPAREVKSSDARKTPDLSLVHNMRVKMNFASYTVRKGPCLCGHPPCVADNQLDVAR